MEEAKTVNKDCKKRKACTVVAGGGAAGSVAAYKLAKAGKHVILLEKGKSFRSSNFARLSGFMGCETRFQKDAGITMASKGELYERMTSWAKGQVNPKLIRNLLEHTSEAAEILTEMGFTLSFYADWRDPSDREKYLNDRIWGALHVINEYGSQRADILTDALKKAGVEILFGYSAEELIMEQGRVTGVKAATKTGDAVEIETAAVFIATGGCGNNKEMMRELFPGAPLCNIGSKNNTGDGIRIAMDAGGVLDPGMGLACNEVCGASLKHREYPFDAEYRMDNHNLAFALYGGMAVDSEGERFFNEELMATIPLTSGDYPALSVGHMYVIMDGEYYDRCCEEGIYRYLGDPEWELGRNLIVPVLERAKDQFAQAEQEGWGYRADTLTEIADHFDLTNLETSVARYNTFCRKGKDEDFGKGKTFLTEIKDGYGYYVFEYAGSYWCTTGGVRSDAKLRVLNRDNQAIPGVYVGGAEMGSAFGRTYYDVAATCAGFSVASGVVAADSILSYIG